MKQNQYKEYILEVAMVLYNFQLIEMALKEYLWTAIKKIKETTKGTIPFKYDKSFVNKDSLGALIEKFEKMNDNQKIITELRRLKPQRNEIAHQGLLLSVKDWNDCFQVAIRIADLQRIRTETRQILDLILIEQRKIKTNNT